jgi:hypothetical protein
VDEAFAVVGGYACSREVEVFSSETADSPVSGCSRAERTPVFYGEVDRCGSQPSAFLGFCLPDDAEVPDS